MPTPGCAPAPTEAKSILLSNTSSIVLRHNTRPYVLSYADAISQERFNNARIIYCGFITAEAHGVCRGRREQHLSCPRLSDQAAAHGHSIHGGWPDGFARPALCRSAE